MHKIIDVPITALAVNRDGPAYLASACAKAGIPPDITLAKQVLEWAPTVPLQEGLEKTIDYFDDLLRVGIDKYNSRWQMPNVKVVSPL